MYEIDKIYKLRVKFPNYPRLFVYTATIVSEDTNSIKIIDKNGESRILSKSCIIDAVMYGNEGDKNGEL